MPFLHGGEGSSFPGRAPHDETVNCKSVVCIKPGDSGIGMVIGYQGDEFTLIWLLECFVS